MEHLPLHIWHTACLGRFRIVPGVISFAHNSDQAERGEVTEEGGRHVVWWYLIALELLRLESNSGHLIGGGYRLSNVQHCRERTYEALMLGVREALVE